ncbi:MAG: lysozyme [Myxococcales bacterium]|nr:lysozyme [Myxococcales bacterium]
MRRLSAAIAVCGLLTCGGIGTAGCSSADAPPSDGCVESGSAALKTCAKGATITGVDISSYQGTVSWSQIKGSGRAFAFARISDGLNSPDSKFAQNWPAMKSAGIVRGAYQYFRPTQDAGLQAQMVLDKLAAAGGLKPGDLPPVLDLETADGLSSSAVVSKAKAWLAKIEAAINVKPIVYTAAFMSATIGTSFGGYTLWVANYGTTCPTMPSGWTDWQFWQSSDSGSVAGIAGNVDTDFFNGTLADLKTHALGAPTTPPPMGGEVAVVAFEGDSDFAANHKLELGGNHPNDGSQGATLGSGTPPATTDGAPITPCHP